MIFRTKLPDLLLEIFSIFIAVTLSFYLDEVRDSRKDEENLKEIVASLIVDIDSYTADMSYGAKYALDGVDTIDLCLKKGMVGEAVSGKLRDTFLMYITDDYSHSTYNSSAYIGLLSSEIWHRLPDSVRRSVFDLYEYDYKSVQLVRQRFADNNVVVKQVYFPKFHYTFYDYNNEGESAFKSFDSLSAHMDFQRSLKDAEFRSVVVNIRNLASQTIWFQKEAAKHSEATSKLLQRFLEKY